MTTPPPEHSHGIGFVLYASAVAAMGGLLFGYDTAVIAGTVEFLQQRFALSDLALGWTVSSALLGCVLGAWSAGWSGLPSSAGELAIARIIGGIGVGAASMLTPVLYLRDSPGALAGRAHDA